MNLGDVAAQRGTHRVGRVGAADPDGRRRGGRDRLRGGEHLAPLDRNVISGLRRIPLGLRGLNLPLRERLALVETLRTLLLPPRLFEPHARRLDLSRGRSPLALQTRILDRYLRVLRADLCVLRLDLRGGG